MSQSISDIRYRTSGCPSPLLFAAAQIAPEQVVTSHVRPNTSRTSGKIKIFMARWRYIIASGLFLAILVSPFSTKLVLSPVASAADSTAATIFVRSSTETYYLQAVNDLRANKGLPALTLDSRLTYSASQKTNHMIEQHYWDHYAPNNGPSFSDFIWGSSPQAVRVGENLARCYDTRAAAFDALVHSPTHYAIMVGNFTNFGVFEAVEPSTGCVYATMHFSLYSE